MSFAICRIQKIGGAKDIAGIQIHNRREREHSNTNPDIDHSKTELNIQLKAPSGSYNATVDDIIQKHYKGKRAVRKDAVRLCEALFTSDKDFFIKSEDGGKAYLTACYEWASERFGKDNIVTTLTEMAIEKENQISPTAVSQAFITKNIREKVKKNIKAVEAERKSHTKTKVKDKGIE